MCDTLARQAVTSGQVEVVVVDESCGEHQDLWVHICNEFVRRFCK